MKSTMDCIPCMVRQALEGVRAATPDPHLHRGVLQEVLAWLSRMELEVSPPSMAQAIQRRIRERTGNPDPYLAHKRRQNAMALELVEGLRERVEAAPDPLDMAVRVAIAGNVIDLGVHAEIGAPDLLEALEQAMAQPLAGDLEALRRALGKARDIVYLADNAGEIVLDRLLIAWMGPERVTLAVRGGAVLNDALLEDAQAAGLHPAVKLLANGSDAPGTLLEDCSPVFRQRLEEADLVLAKGQGNYESLFQASREIFFLFKAKCRVIAELAGVPLGAHVVARTPGSRS